MSRSKPIPKATHEGTLALADVRLDCSVLDTGVRVFTANQLINAMGMYKSGALSARLKEEGGGARTPVFLSQKNLSPFVQAHLTEVHRATITFQNKQGKVVEGLPAEALPAICWVYVDAKTAGVLGPRQVLVAEVASGMLRSLTGVAINALVDEAAGFQQVRDPDALQTMLNLFLLPYMAKWSKRFPDEFYRGIYRLRGWPWTGMAKNRPQVVAHYTKDLVYARLAPGILHELEERMPRDDEGKRAGRLHQFLTDDVGHPALSQHLHATIGFMKVCSSWPQFVHLMDQAFPRRGDTLQLPGMGEVPGLVDGDAQ